MTLAAVVGLVSGPTLGGIAVLGALAAWALVPLGLGVLLVGELPRTLHRLAWLERARVRTLLGAPLPPVPVPPVGPTGWAAVRATAGDVQAWRTLVWLTGQVVLGPLALVAVLALLGGPLFLLTLPVWTWSVERFPLLWFSVTTPTDALAAAAVGLVLLPLAVLLVRLVGRAQATAATRWLGPDVRRQLEAKVADLERTRAIAVLAAESERRRLERDLHDGAQSRLVALAVTLALAEEALDRDTEVSRDLLREAREEAVGAVEELRGLARGLAPTLLRTRGLQAALDGLAATSAVAVEVDTSRYLEPASEELASALYFTAAEALTNAAKHAGASQVRIELVSRGRAWCLEVRDDGRGGAVLRPGGGLAGLRDRLAPLDAALELLSDERGTTVRVSAT